MNPTAIVFTSYPEYSLSASDLGWAPGVFPDFIVITGQIPSITGRVIGGPVLYARGSALRAPGGDVAGFYYQAEVGRSFIIFNE